MQPREHCHPNTTMLKKGKKKNKRNLLNLKQQAPREVILLVSIMARKVIYPLNVGEGLMLDAINAIRLDMKLSFERTRVNNKK